MDVRNTFSRALENTAHLGQPVPMMVIADDATGNWKVVSFNKKGDITNISEQGNGTMQIAEIKGNMVKPIIEFGTK